MKCFSISGEKGSSFTHHSIAEWNIWCYASMLCFDAMLFIRWRWFYSFFYTEISENFTSLKRDCAVTRLDHSMTMCAFEYLYRILPWIVSSFSFGGFEGCSDPPERSLLLGASSPQGVVCVIFRLKFELLFFLSVSPFTRLVARSPVFALFMFLD